MKRTRLFCVLLAAAMLLSLAACGKDDPKESNSLQIGDYALLYKGASIMEDSDGNDALVLTLDFTNNSKDSGSYVWSVSETAMQNGAELAIATVFANSDSYDTVIDSQFTDVAPGETLELRTAFVLADTTSKVEVTFEEAFGDKTGKITVDPSTLSREAAGSGTGQDTGTGDITHCAPSSIVDQLGAGGYTHDPLTDYLEEVKERTRFHYWLFGHYHDNKILDDRFVLLWEQMTRVV